TSGAPTPSIFTRLRSVLTARLKANVSNLGSSRANSNSIASERTDSGTVATLAAAVPHLVYDTLGYLVRHGDHMALYPSSRSPPTYAEDALAWASLYDMKTGMRRSSKSYPTPPIAEDESMAAHVSRHTRECAYGAVDILRVFLANGSGPLLTEQAIHVAITAMNREHPGSKTKQVERRCKAVVAALKANMDNAANWSIFVSLVEAFRSLVRSAGANDGDVNRAAALKVLLDVWPLYFMSPVAFEWLCGRPDPTEHRQVNNLWTLLFSAPGTLYSQES
ncbi:hypothetical protein BCR44DRAFT_34858, partial [Catenaria anguillulae PL171]